MPDKLKHNPYGNPDGSPRKGQEEEFMKYAREHATDNRNEIPPSDEEIIVDAEKAIGERMDSDPEA